MKFNCIAFSAATVLSSIVLSSLASAAPISTSPTTYVDELAFSRTYFPEVSRDDVLKSLSEGNLVSIGETHETGLERTYLKDLYDTLKTTLAPLPTNCLVENYEELLATTDPVRASFNQVCPEAKVFNNLAGSDYTPYLATDLPQGRVLTHTGSRHVFPIALMYPEQDFPSPQWVDIPVHGSIVKQLPDNFESSGMQMRGLAMRELDDLYMSRVATDVQALAGPSVSDVALKLEADKVRGWSTSLHYADGEIAKLFETHRINLSFPFAKAYVALLNRTDFDPALLIRLLESDQLKTLLQTTDPKDLTIGCFITDSPNETFGAGSLSIAESGTIYAYSPSLTTQKVVMVSISKSHDVQTDNSSF